MNRRKFVSAGSAGAISLIACCLGCNQNKLANPEPCNDLSGLSETDLHAREALSYVEQSPYDDQLCENCQFWIAGKEGEACGGCVSIKGPIYPKGYCTYWAPVIQ